MKILVYDYETTGTDTKTCSVLGFAAIQYDTETGEFLEIKSFYDCEGEIPEQATNVHGITKEMVAGKSLFGKKNLAIDLVSKAPILVGYNHIHYDNKITYRYGVNTFEKKNIDVYLIVKENKDLINFPDDVKMNLSNVYQHVTGKEPVGAHDALSDCRMTLETLLELDKKIGVFKSIDSEEEKVEDFVVDRGKYKGLKFSEVYEKDSLYALWFCKNVELSEAKKEFMMKTLNI